MLVSKWQHHVIDDVWNRFENISALHDTWLLSLFSLCHVLSCQLSHETKTQACVFVISCVFRQNMKARGPGNPKLCATTQGNEKARGRTQIMCSTKHNNTRGQESARPERTRDRMLTQQDRTWSMSRDGPRHKRVACIKLQLILFFLFFIRDILCQWTIVIIRKLNIK